MRPSPRLLALAVIALACAWARPALADCTTDTDCPGATCGSEVCQWTVSGHTCVPAGTDPPGFDGWCSIDVNCKCAGQGATCSAALSHCTFTIPQDAATASAGDAGGSSSSTTNTAGCGVAPSLRHGGGGLALLLCALGAVAGCRRRAVA